MGQSFCQKTRKIKLTKENVQKPNSCDDIKGEITVNCSLAHSTWAKVFVLKIKKKKSYALLQMQQTKHATDEMEEGKSEKKQQKCKWNDYLSHNLSTNIYHFYG